MKLKVAILLVFSLFGVCANVIGQVTILNAWTSTTSAANTHVVAAGTNRMLIYIIEFEDDDNTNDVTAVTYGTRPMTQAVQATLISGSENRVEIWYLLEAGIALASSTTFTPTFSISNPATSHGYYTMAVTLGGVHQTTPVCATGTGTSAGTTTVSLSAGMPMLSSEMFIFGTSGGNGLTETITAGFTEAVELTGGGGGQSGTANFRAGAVATFNPTATATGSQNRFVMAAIRILPAGASCSSALPIELISFEAKLAHNEVELAWSTASETNNDFFTVEKSSNGIDFAKVLEVDGASNSNQLLEYSGSDRNVTAGISYYRLKQTDFDGNYTYSELVTVNTFASDLSGISIYPNPTTGSFSISGYGAEAKILVFNSLGELVLSKGVNDVVSPIDVSSLMPGLYLVQVHYAGAVSQQKLVLE